MVAEDSGDPAGVLIEVDKGSSLNAIPALPPDRERGIGFLGVNQLAFTVSSQPCGEPISGVEQPGIAGFGGEQDQLTEGDDVAVMWGGPALNIGHLIGETKTFAFTIRLPGPSLMACGARPGLVERTKELFTELFGDLLAFVYHCFDRIVIYGYLSGLSRP